MDSDNRAHNHWFLVAQAQKISVLQVVVSDEDACNRNGKTIQSTFSSTLNLLSSLPYSTNSIPRIHIPLEISCITWYSPQV